MSKKCWIIFKKKKKNMLYTLLLSTINNIEKEQKHTDLSSQANAKYHPLLNVTEVHDEVWLWMPLPMLKILYPPTQHQHPTIEQQQRLHRYIYHQQQQHRQVVLSKESSVHAPERHTWAQAPSLQSHPYVHLPRNLVHSREWKVTKLSMTAC